MIILSIVLIILAVAKPYSKRVFFLSFIILWSSITFQTLGIADTNGYQYAFSHSFETLSNTPPFGVISYVCNFLTFNYRQYLGVISLISLIIIYYIIVKTVKEVNLIVILYFIFPFIIDSVQKRNLLASVILFFAWYRYFLKQDKVITYKDSVEYLLLILLATSIHMEFIFYSIFVFIPYVSQSREKTIRCLLILLALVISFLFILVNKQLFLYLATFLGSYAKNKICYYFEHYQNTPFLGLLITSLLDFIIEA